MGLNLRDLEDAEQFQKHFVTPLVEAVRQEVQPVVAQTRQNTEDIATLKANQKKALWGWSWLVAVASSVLAILAAEFKKRFF